MDADDHEKQMKLRAYGFGVLAGLYLLCIRAPQIYSSSKNNADTLREFSSLIETSSEKESSLQYKGVISSQLIKLRALNLSEDNPAHLEGLIKDAIDSSGSVSLERIKQGIEKISCDERIIGSNTAINYGCIGKILAIISGIKLGRLRKKYLKNKH